MKRKSFSLDEILNKRKFRDNWILLDEIVIVQAILNKYVKDPEAYTEATECLASLAYEIGGHELGIEYVKREVVREMEIRYAGEGNS